MKRIVASLVLAALLVSCSATRPPAVAAGSTVIGPAPAGVVTGVVTTLDGQPLPGVTVSLTRPEGAPLTRVTNVDGRYEFRDIAPGPAVARFRLDGLTPTEQPIEVTESSGVQLATAMRFATTAHSVTDRKQ